MEIAHNLSRFHFLTRLYVNYQNCVGGIKKIIFESTILHSCNSHIAILTFKSEFKSIIQEQERRTTLNNCRDHSAIMIVMLNVDVDDDDENDDDEAITGTSINYNKIMELNKFRVSGRQ
jgi:hypothetical protein